MDKDRAKFVLQSFRPDGADAGDEDFAQALQLATSDRELGEWLMRERAFDAEFAEALARVDLPEGLREDVLLAMVQNGSEFPKVDLQGERKMMAAVAAIPVPDGLRERILEAMDQTVKPTQSNVVWWRFGIPLAAAAGIALAFILMSDGGHSGIAEHKNTGIPIEAVQASFVRTFESPLFSLDTKAEEVPELITYLRGKSLPCGDGMVPPGLVGVQGLGCRELSIDGKKGSLICFDDAGGTVHLIIFLREDVKGDLPGIDHPRIERSGNWAKASWEQGRYAFALMGMRDNKSLSALF